MGSCSRIWSGGFCFASPHSSLLLQVHTDLADISWKAMRNQCKLIKWRGWIWRNRWKSSPATCMYVLYQSSHRDSRCLTFSHYIHSVAAVSSSVIGHRCCDIYPYLVMQSSPATLWSYCLCVEFWKKRCFPVSLQESWMFPLCYPVHLLLPLGMPVSILHKAWASCR